MRRTGRLSISLATFAVLASSASTAQAQIFVGAGSTPAGDYLRGLGIADWGMGQYNLSTAQANSINLDTGIRWNEYLAAVAKQQTREYVARIVADATKRKEFYKQNRDRLLNSPEARDVTNADALNGVLEELQNANLGDSTYRSDRVRVILPVDVIRHIPFRLGDKGEQFSMDRLSLKGSGKWTVALQDPRFDHVKRQYALALDKALGQAIDGKMEIPAIEEVDARADDLYRKLDEVVGPSNDRLYIEGRERLNELKATVRTLKTTKVEAAIGEIDKYSGTTVNDLKKFMLSHGLRFAAAKTPGEKARYPEIYAYLKEQLEKVKTPDANIK
jgi:hypothetical protein